MGFDRWGREQIYERDTPKVRRLRKRALRKFVRQQTKVDPEHAHERRRVKGGG